MSVAPRPVRTVFFVAVVLMAYVAGSLLFAAHCGEGRVAVVGLLGPQCVCKGAWR